MRLSRFFVLARRTRRSGAAVVAGALLIAGATSLLAQDRYDPTRAGFPSSPVRVDDRGVFGVELPVYVSVVEGYAELDRGGQSSRDIENVPLEAGDRLRTTRGRAELLFEDGSSVALDEHTSVVVVEAGSLDLLAGRLRVQWRNRDRATGMTISTSAGQVRVQTTGDYRVSLGPSSRGDAEIEVAVAAGAAELGNAAGRTLVRERTRALTVAGMAPSLPYRFVPPRDEFERWTDDVERDRYGVESGRYLPDELRYYGGVFDQNGYWRNHHSYGWVWYPRVSVGWRPYVGGRWSFVVGFGYSWVGGSRWAWPTHHYGRWDCVGTTWFWIPSRPDHRRAVGYAAPRSSYNDRVTYYRRADVSRTITSRPVAPRGDRWQPSERPSSRDARPAARPQPTRPDTDRPTAVRRGGPGPSAGRTSEGRQSEGRQSEGRQPEARPSSSRPSPSRRDDDRSGSSTRSAPPQRSAPSATSERPPSGSRTPSRASGGSGGSSSSGTARRRGGG